MGTPAWEDAEAPRRRGGLVVLAALAIGGVLALTAGVADRSIGEDLVIERDVEPPPVDPAETGFPDQTQPAPTPPPGAAMAQLEGEWEAREPAPVEVPRDYHGVWTGALAEGGLGLVVVGGERTAAAFDPAGGVWSALPAPPFELLAGDPVWADGVLVAFESSVDGEGRVAALTPGAPAWALSAPSPTRLRTFAAVWTGEEIIRLGYGADSGGSEAPGPVAADAFRPATSSWRSLPQPPVAALGSVAGLPVDAGAVFWGRHTGDGTADSGQEHFAVAYRAEDDAWVQLPPPPLHEPADAAAVSTGAAVLLWGQPPAGPAETGGSAPSGAALRVAEAVWQPLPPVPGDHPPPSNRYGYAAAWTGQRMVVIGGYPQGVALSHQPLTGSWAQLPSAGGLVRPVLAWSGEELLLWGGYGWTGPTVELRSFSPPRPTWTQRRFRRGDLLVF